MSNYEYTDEDGDKIYFYGGPACTPSISLQNGDVFAETYVPPKEALKLATALVESVPGYNHSQTLKANTKTILNSERDAVVTEFGFSGLDYDLLSPSTRSVIDALIEARASANANA